MKKTPACSAASLCLFATVGLGLTACGGSDGDGTATATGTATSTPVTTTPAVSTKRVTGALLAPETTAATSAKATAILLKDEAVLQVTDPSCTGVPASYTPIANTAVAFTDATGRTVNASAVTDVCGRFDVADVPGDAVTVSFAASAAYQALSMPIAALADRDGDGVIDPVSTLPTGATLSLTGVTVSGDRIAFIARDSLTGKAVLGIPATAVAVTAPTGALALSQLTYSAAASPASIALVLDASGSMASNAATGSTLVRYQVAAAAAKLFVDRIGLGDQVGTVVFDNTADFLNSTYFTATWAGRIVNAAGQDVPLGLTPAGFSSDKTLLNRLIDFYNTRSDSWRLATATVRFIGRAYPWGGSTALWDAVGLGVDRVATQAGRHFVVAMTDGEDNASRQNVAAITTKAVAAKVPVFTVGIGSVSSVNTTQMQGLSNATGGNFTLVADGDVQARLASAFDSIRTGIQFQYAGTLAGATAGTAVKVTIDHAGLRADSTVTAN